MEKLSNLNKYLIGTIAGLVILLIGCVTWNQNLQRNRENWKHNYEVLQDSVEVIQTKYGGKQPISSQNKTHKLSF